MRAERIQAMRGAPTSAKPSAVSVALSTGRSCWRRSVNGSAIRTNAIAGWLTGTAM
jgi:hypothetical protein